MCATIKGVSSFSAEQKAQALRKAMKGTDEDAIIDILTKLNVSQCQQVLITYKSTTGRVGCLQRCLSGNFERVIIRIMTSITTYDMHELRRAVKGAGTDEGCLIEIVASHTNEEIGHAMCVFLLESGCSLEDDNVSDTSFMFRRLLVSLATGNRNEGMYVDDAFAQQDVQCLYKAGEKKWETDEVQFMSFFMVQGHYLEGALLAVGECSAFRRCLQSNEMMRGGLGTDDSTLIRVKVSRSEIDMLDIRREFLLTYRKSLYSFMKVNLTPSSLAGVARKAQTPMLVQKEG
uniref:Annexin n=1 Tax=Phasianus colchicus TaxID=9054 RepID=A0A669QN49_PHACC